MSWPTRLALLGLAAAWPASLATQPPAAAAPLAATPKARAPAAPEVASRQEAAARRALAERAPAWGLSAAGAGRATLAGRHDPGEGPVVLVFRRAFAGVEVLSEQAAVVLDRAGEAVATLGALDGGAPRPGEAFTLGEAPAAARGLAEVAGLEVAPGALVRGQAAGPWQVFTGGAPGASARVRRGWRSDGGALAATWAVEVMGPPGPDRRLELVYLSDDGRVRERRPLAFDAAFSYRVFGDATAPLLPWDGPTGLAGTPHPTGHPDGTQPPTVAPALVTLQNASATRPDPWLPDGATETAGNNAEVYLVDPATAATVHGAASAPGAFDHLVDLTLPPDGEESRQAGLAHVFYLVDVLHDWLLDAGFDEAAGNAQADNLGRGGLAGDRLLVETQVASVRNNARMLAASDGASPVLQLGLFTGIVARYVAWGAPPPGRPEREEATSSRFGAPAFDLAAPLVPVDDGVAPSTDGCEAGPWATDVTGRVALLDAAGCQAGTGACGCSEKAFQAQAHGAAGVVMAGDVPGQYLFLSLLPADDRVTIPVLGVRQEEGAAFRAAAGAAGGVVAIRMHRSPAVPARDGALDSLLVTHEWGHLLTSRLVGGGAGLGTPQALALGEGWSDFLALLLAARPEDAASPAGAGFGGVYAYGAWVMGGAEALYGGPNQSFYFGMRRVPYTTDLGRNALTFRHVQDGEPLPLATPGGAPIPFADDGLANSEVHNAGEVWATMLWECYAALLRDTLGPAPRLTFAEAQGRMRRYLVASLRATPPDPTLLEARDALLAVALAGDPADQARFWQAFAKRGAGQGASGPDRASSDLRPVRESYRSPDDGAPGGGGGCQVGAAGPLSLLAVAGLAARRRRRPGARAGRG